ncbi:YqaJ viral recombinase family protein [bacterium BD-1]|nr:YqaJ viral recombinase family protein [Ottowia caeni]
MKQGSQEWLNVRGGKITGSRFAQAMARKNSKRYADFIDLLVEERRLGTSLDGDFMNDAMRWGVEHEPLARSWYVKRKRRKVQEVAFVPHQSLSHVGVSPDGLVGEDGLIEIKCPQRPGFDEVLATERMPTRYRWQVQGGLWVCERSWADFICFYPPGEGVILRIEADENDFDQLEDRCKEILRTVEGRLAAGSKPKRTKGVVQEPASPAATAPRSYPVQPRQASSEPLHRVGWRGDEDRESHRLVAQQKDRATESSGGWRIPIWVWVVLLAALAKGISMLLR